MNNVSIDPEVFRFIALKGALKLEILGMKRSRNLPSAYSILKNEYGYKGSKQKVFDRVEADLEGMISRRTGIELKPEWCKCGGDKECEFLCYPEDGQCTCGIHKHHVHGKCGYVTQVG